MSKMQDDGGPAFPVPSYVNADGETHSSKPCGMSYRRYVATHALAALVSSPHQGDRDLPVDQAARAAWAYADALLKTEAT